jgi:hypothetical protein
MTKMPSAGAQPHTGERRRRVGYKHGLGGLHATDFIVVIAYIRTSDTVWQLLI